MSIEITLNSLEAFIATLHKAKWQDHTAYNSVVGRTTYNSIIGHTVYSLVISHTAYSLVTEITTLHTTGGENKIIHLIIT